MGAEMTVDELLARVRKRKVGMWVSSITSLLFFFLFWVTVNYAAKMDTWEVRSRDSDPEGTIVLYLSIMAVCFLLMIVFSIKSILASRAIEKHGKALYENLKDEVATLIAAGDNTAEAVRRRMTLEDQIKQMEAKRKALRI